MNKKLQVFVSSTYTDLKEERQMAVTAILDAGHIPAGMELFGAGESQKETIKKWIDDSDVYMLILGGRYGTIDDVTQKSYTHWEYEYALAAQKPIFAILLTECYLYDKAKNNVQSKYAVLEKKNITKYNKFKDIVKQNIVFFANNIDQIHTYTIKQLNSYMQDGEHSFTGWIKGSDTVSTLFSQGNYAVLKPEVKEQLFSYLYAGNLMPNQEPSNELKDLIFEQFRRFESLKDSFTLYMKDFTRDIDLTLYDDYIEIENTTSIHFYKKKGESFTYVFEPWLRPGIESESYQFLDLKYNHDSQNDKSRYIKYGEFKKTQNPFYQSGGVGISIPFEEEAEFHNLVYIGRYRTDYALFFHSFSFKQFCKTFRLRVQLSDKRSDVSKDKYVLKWEMFTPNADYEYNSKEMMRQTDDLIQFASVPWMYPSSGYIVTLNHLKK